MSEKKGIDVSSDTFFLVYTCGKCETRNAIKVNRIAWERGLVIGKCFGCDAKHLLADKTGLTDETNSTKFSNAFVDAFRSGRGARRLTTNDAETLAKVGLELSADGNLSLIPKPGQQIAFLDNQTGRILALSDANLSTTEEDLFTVTAVQEESPFQNDYQNKIDKVEIGTDPLEAPTVVLPEGVRPGDVLNLKLQDDRTIHVRVPQNSQPGAVLMVEGLVEVRSPLNVTEGDVLTVRLPDGDSVSVLLRDAEAQPGALIAVGFPVSILQSPTSKQALPLSSPSSSS
eukprot:CAMPEP_0197310656 /NCGR_PEP_ID=MMETSP0891-20130614/9219_1 /TAXON_ID=44058 ORGANISM="Aureoumbra lagunensis, Strain CCMP1510" /NCGR_SAMPLE_ID=MMETSP0891 /ASSEMBLY_ACC=CAM_ASM_000534 /LENGTH=285 /DNA_ID=CAMNT_0042796393 /DNA_START=193 /DNA_END=1050 /DNA_ORIENTATION=+